MNEVYFLNENVNKKISRILILFMFCFSIFNQPSLSLVGQFKNDFYKNFLEKLNEKNNNVLNNPQNDDPNDVANNSSDNDTTNGLTTVSDRLMLIFATLAYHNADTVENMLKDLKTQSPEFKKLASKREVSGWEVIQYDINEKMGNKSSFSAITFCKEDEYILAYRGVDSGIFKEGWKPFMSKQNHPQTIYAIKYTKKFLKLSSLNKNSKIYITGHSLGGYLALISAACICCNVPEGLNNEDEDDNRITQRNLKWIRTFNSVGVGKKLSLKFKNALKNLKHKIKNYKIKGDTVSKFGDLIVKAIEFNFNSWNESPHSKIYYMIAGPHSIWHFYKIDQFALKKDRKQKLEVINSNDEVLDHPA